VRRHAEPVGPDRAESAEAKLGDLGIHGTGVRKRCRDLMRRADSERFSPHQGPDAPTGKDAASAMKTSEATMHRSTHSRCNRRRSCAAPACWLPCSPRRQRSQPSMRSRCTTRASNPWHRWHTLAMRFVHKSAQHVGCADGLLIPFCTRLHHLLSRRFRSSRPPRPDRFNGQRHCTGSLERALGQFHSSGAIRSPRSTRRWRRTTRSCSPPVQGLVLATTSEVVTCRHP